jgi:hypothetical protein
MAIANNVEFVLAIVEGVVLFLIFFYVFWKAKRVQQMKIATCATLFSVNTAVLYAVVYFSIYTRSTLSNNEFLCDNLPKDSCKLVLPCGWCEDTSQCMIFDCADKDLPPNCTSALQFVYDCNFSWSGYLQICLALGILTSLCGCVCLTAIIVGIVWRWRTTQRGGFPSLFEIALSCFGAVVGLWIVILQDSLQQSRFGPITAKDSRTALILGLILIADFMRIFKEAQR